MHIPVLLDELLNIVQPASGQIVIDATYGGGGHAQVLAKAVGPKGRVLAIDRDPAVATGQAAAPNITLLQGNFANLTALAQQAGINQADLILADLGLSSLQLADQSRGFSFEGDGPLDLRFDPTTGETAARLLQRLKPAELEHLFRTYGELPAPLTKKLVQLLVQTREKQPIVTAVQLSTLARGVLAHYPWSPRENKYLAQLYQALRIAVNQELEAIKVFLPQALDLLKPGGKLAVIAFHSLEDRLVKRFYQQESQACLCPASYPVCRCGHQTRLYLLTRKAVQPTVAEVAKNPRARSARLRIAQKC